MPSGSSEAIHPHFRQLYPTQHSVSGPYPGLSDAAIANPAQDRVRVTVFGSLAERRDVGANKPKAAMESGLVGFWRVPSRAHRLVSSGTCRICSRAV